MIEIRKPGQLEEAFPTFKGQLVEVTIPSWATLTPEQRARVDAGDPWPIVMHVAGADNALIDNLIERSIEAWISKASE